MYAMDSQWQWPEWQWQDAIALHNAQEHGHFLDSQPQVHWWMKQMDDLRKKSDFRKKVGTLRPTNLAHTERTKSTQGDKEQRLRASVANLFPKVFQPLRPPTDLSVAIALSELENTRITAVDSLQQVREMLNGSFKAAQKSVESAAKAYEELCAQTNHLKHSCCSHIDWQKLKLAKTHVRDVLLWRWFGLTTWIYNHVGAEFFQSYGREMESQLMNSVAKIRQSLMQHLMRRPCWKKMEHMLVNCTHNDAWTGEWKDLLDRITFVYHLLGGSLKPGLQHHCITEELQHYCLAEEEKTQMFAEEAVDAKLELDYEQQFEELVWDHAAKQVSDSVIDFLGLDDDDDDGNDPLQTPLFANGASSTDTDPIPCDVINDHELDVLQLLEGQRREIVAMQASDETLTFVDV